MTSEGAVKANETRRARADAHRLHQAFVGEKRNVVTECVIPFLLDHTPQDGIVGDTLGGGSSASEMTSAGLRVLSCDDLTYAKTNLGLSDDRAERAARYLAREVGVAFVRGDFAAITDRIDTAFFDPCGPLYAGSPSAKAIASAHSNGVGAMAVTVMLSRVLGAKEAFGGDPDYYLSLAEAVLRRIAPDYRVIEAVKYAGRGRVPMAVLLLCRKPRWGDGRCVACHNRYHRLHARQIRATRPRPVRLCRDCGTEVGYAGLGHPPVRCVPCRSAFDRAQHRARARARRAALQADPERRAQELQKRRTRYATDIAFREKRKAESRAYVQRQRSAA